MKETIIVFSLLMVCSFIVYRPFLFWVLRTVTRSKRDPLEDILACENKGMVIEYKRVKYRAGEDFFDPEMIVPVDKHTALLTIRGDDKILANWMHDSATLKHWLGTSRIRLFNTYYDVYRFEQKPNGDMLFYIARKQPKPLTQKDRIQISLTILVSIIMVAYAYAYSEPAALIPLAITFFVVVSVLLADFILG